MGAKDIVIGREKKKTVRKEEWGGRQAQHWVLNTDPKGKRGDTKKRLGKGRTLVLQHQPNTDVGHSLQREVKRRGEVGSCVNGGG